MKVLQGGWTWNGVAASMVRRLWASLILREGMFKAVRQCRETIRVSMPIND